jgi:hypothetical protein
VCHGILLMGGWKGSFSYYGSSPDAVGAGGEA